jgi:hypothetical protein
LRSGRTSDTSATVSPPSHDLPHAHQSNHHVLPMAPPPLVQPTTHSQQFYIDAHPEPERENPVGHVPVKSCSRGHGYYQGRSCPECKRLENRRPSSTQRGYGATHKRLREHWANSIRHSTVLCSRCGKPIGTDENWDLDHTDDRQGYRGPSHSTCNRARLSA